MDIDAIAAGGGGDRLSRLSDAVLGHILSFLPAPEAARAAALSRRWRHVFATVHTLSFDEADDGPTTDGDDEDDAYSVWSSDYYNYSPAPKPRSVPAPPFATGVLAALLGRHRGAAHAPLQAIGVKFDQFSEAASARAVDALVTYAVLDAGDYLRQVDLRFGGGPICNREYSLRRSGSKSSPPGTNSYVVPTTLFSCSALRTIRLGPCKLSLPSAITLPSLDTLHLVRVTDTATNIQRLVSACPRLADLRLKACRPLTTLSILDTHLRSLTLKCCHDLASVTVDSSELQTFKYRGAVPSSPSFLTMHGARRVSWCALDFCGDEASDPAAELTGLVGFLQLFASTKYLRLKSARLGCSIGHDIFSSVSHGFPILSHIEITGMVPDSDTAVVATMARILEWSPSLETVSLFFLPELREIDEKNQYYNEDEVPDAHKLSYRYVDLPVPEGALIRCLRERTREINFVHYQGAMAQRMVAKFLLRNAPVVEEVCCEFATGPLFIQTRLMEEIREWTVNTSANMMFF